MQMDIQSPHHDAYHFVNNEEKTEEEKELDNWLPITSDRTAKWYYSAFHNVTAIIGAGVLNFPYAMAALGWGPGIIMLVLSWIITLFTLRQMVQMHEIDGRRFDRYHELGQIAFGKQLGLWIVVPQQLVVEVGVDIVYMVLGGQCLQRIQNAVKCPNSPCNAEKRHDPNEYTSCCDQIKLTYFIMIFASAHFLLSHLPNFNSISGVSLVAAVMSLSYSTIAWSASVGNMAEVHNVEHRNIGNEVFRFFSALGSIVFAYTGHNVVLEIQATIPSTRENPSKIPMRRGVKIAYIIVALCYFPVAIVGYLIFGNNVEENILMSLKKPIWLIVMAYLFVVVHLIGSYQVYAMPVFDMLEAVLVRKFRFRPTFWLRFIVRTAYVSFTMFVAIGLPFFHELLGFFGGFAFAPTTYFLPCIIWLKIYRPKKFSLSWFQNWICITLGVLVMIFAPIGGLKLIIDRAKTWYHHPVF